MTPHCDTALLAKEARPWPTRLRTWLGHCLSLCLTACLLSGPGGVQAQSIDEPPMQLPADEVQRLREILDRPVDPGALNTLKDEIYRQKDSAAWKLGDTARHEALLREWAQFSNDGKWSLRNFLANTEKRPEAYQLGRELLVSNTWPPSAVRLRATLAINYIDDSNLKEAGALLEQSEKIIREQWRSIRQNATTPFWMARAEAEHHNVKSLWLMRSGKWQEGIQTAHMAVAKGKDMLSQDASMDARMKTYARGYMLFIYSTLAAHQIAAGAYADAEWTLREAYQLARQSGLSDNQLVGFYNRYADLRNAAGQHAEALKYARRAQAIVVSQGYQPGSHNWLFPQIRINVALAGQDRWSEALAELERVDRETTRLNNSKSSAARQVFVRSLVYIQSGRPADALPYLRGTLDWHEKNYGPDHYFTAIARGLHASALARSGDAAQARPHFEQAMRNITAPDLLLGDFVEDAFRKKTKRFIFQSYMQMLAQTATQQPQDAQTLFQLADFLNASTVQQALNDAAARSVVDVPGLSDIIRQEQDAKNEMASLMAYIGGQASEGDGKRVLPQVVEQMRVRLRELEGQRRTYKAEIQKRYPEYFQLIQPKAPSHTDIAQRLQADELFVQVLPLDGETYVWAVDHQGRLHFHLWNQGSRQINEAVDGLRRTLDVVSLGDKAPPFDHAGAHRMYQGLFGPMEAMLGGKGHVILATSGPLAKLPLAVLLRKPHDPRDKSVPPWLIRDVAISQVPTASGWLALKRFGRVAATERPMMAWGDPTYDLRGSTRQGDVTRSADLPRARSTLTAHAQASGDLDSGSMNFLRYARLPALPETRDEVLQLNRILGGKSDADVFLGAKATRASVLRQSASGELARKQVIVFATHGLLAGDLPNVNQPALAMAATADPAESPLLTLEDVLGLKLNADWVVLSACNTAGADGRAEEALSGLARGFFYAGSRSLLVTHWSVESESAVLLTTGTFEAYKNHPQMRRADALRAAMLQTMKSPDYAHPAFWAPYALVGEGGR
jgi:CHAT domain-containing protein